MIFNDGKKGRDEGGSGAVGPDGGTLVDQVKQHRLALKPKYNDLN